MKFFVCFVTVVPCLLCLASGADPEEVPGGDGLESGRGELGGAEFKLLYRVLEECEKRDFESCIAVKAVTFIDRAMRRNSIDLSDSVSLVKTEGGAVEPMAGRALTEAELENSLPQDQEEKSNRLFALLFERVATFFKSRTLSIKFPETSAADLKSTLEEGRKMKKLLMPILLGLKLKAATLIPLALGGLALLAGKALLVSKIALLLAGLIGLKKLFSHDSGSSYEVVSHGHHGYGGGSYGGGGGGGHYRRSFDEVPANAHQMAYRAYVPQQDAPVYVSQ